MKEKRVKDSKTIMSIMVTPDKSNNHGTMHGGEIMRLMDETAYVVAKKHCRCDVSIVTARVDELEFYRPIHIEDVVTVTGELVFVGKSSMEVYVLVEVDHLSCGDKGDKVALSAYFTMVAKDKEGNRYEVPRLVLMNKEEEEKYQLGNQRYLKYKEKKKTNV
ncbi:acyl-CoA hydrolase [Natranaerovirga pectinivora]|uniref:Acyl-CoA hydrolase n=1 Tax=Natranaerovirga pectinivora TaxID=682400 RepID=A0A4R3MJN5_9FIRM|nr:acyl-CoA thioesterase [Natranaerovirga pectinivora]TCT14266.1 acyl-CoA hydrolase [Natranaerovirga pectinivora]